MVMFVVTTVCGTWFRIMCHILPFQINSDEAFCAFEQSGIWPSAQACIQYTEWPKTHTLRDPALHICALLVP